MSLVSVRQGTCIDSIPDATQLVTATKIVIRLKASAEPMGIRDSSRVCRGSKSSENSDGECLDHFETKIFLVNCRVRLQLHFLLLPGN